MEIYCFYEKAIRELAPEANWCIFNNSLEEIEWRSEDIEQPSIEDIEAKAQELYEEHIENAPTGDPAPPVGIFPQ
jgi:hypothetical protein